MNAKVIGKCPVCNHNLKVTRLSCNNCHTSIEGNFDLCKFSRLSKEQRAFLEVFVKNRGNIRDIERELNISYPTVKSRLDNLIESLSYNPKDSEPAISRRDVLKRLENGQITPKEAVKLLKGE
ncbi:MAG TPA: DUF2089 domain-containing protein [Tissierellaceae bacterium]|nr:DUF2089 domain-containing protein [Tissierellaceae bacterium]